MRRVLEAFLCIALFLVPSGCGTANAVAANDPFPNQIYGGVRNELNPVSIHTFFDIPFSAIADTLVLPYTIARTIYNCHHPELRPQYDQWGELIRATRRPASTSTSFGR
jgi:uncharacterized protein YceK